MTEESHAGVKSVGQRCASIKICKSGNLSADLDISGHFLQAIKGEKEKKGAGGGGSQNSHIKLGAKPIFSYQSNVDRGLSCEYGSTKGCSLHLHLSYCEVSEAISSTKV